MKTFQLFLTVMLLLGLATAAFAQNDEEAQRNAHGKARMKAEMYAAWNDDNSLTYDLLGRSDVRKRIGLSNEQYQKIRDVASQRSAFNPTEAPVTKPILDEIAKLTIEMSRSESEEKQKELNERRTELLKQQREQMLRLVATRTPQQRVPIRLF